MTYGVGNPGPDLRQEQKLVCRFSCLDLPFYIWMFIDETRVILQIHMI